MNGLTFRAVRRDEIPAAAAQSITAFGGRADAQQETEERFDRHRQAGELWGVAGESGLVGHCRLLRTDHYFGGRAVACMDVAGVAVPREHRRQGVATAMLEGAVAWGAHEGMALSLLFPGVPGLYRRLGWEHAGTFPSYELAVPMALPAAERMRQATADDWHGITACHERFITTLNGPGRRSPRRWETLRGADRQQVLDGANGIEAYVLRYRNAQPGEQPDDPPSVDWAATTPRGTRAVAAALAGHVLRGASVRGAGPHLWSPWTDSWNAPATAGLLWMARPLLLQHAVASRGFARGIAAAVTITLDDPLVVESRRTWRLEVAEGRGELTPAREGAVVMETRAVGPLFTGFSSPRQLASAGLLDGPPDDLEALAAMFAGTPPVALDFF